MNAENATLKEALGDLDTANQQLQRDKQLLEDTQLLLEQKQSQLELDEESLQLYRAQIKEETERLQQEKLELSELMMQVQASMAAKKEQDQQATQEPPKPVEEIEVSSGFRVQCSVVQLQ